MCGVCGFAVPAASGYRIDEAVLVRMRDTLAHRGPDDAGLFVDAQAALGHRRLSIVDLAGGHQPMPNEDCTIWISYNGEVYNHRELRQRLEQIGHSFEAQATLRLSFTCMRSMASGRSSIYEECSRLRYGIRRAASSSSPGIGLA